MTTLGPVLLVLLLALAGWWTGRARARVFARAGPDALNSRPVFHGWFVALAAAAPALLFLAIWPNIAPGLASRQVLAQPEAAAVPADRVERAQVLSEARLLSRNGKVTAPSPQVRALAPLYLRADRTFAALGWAGALLLGFLGGLYAFLRLKPDFRARARVEGLALLALLAASLIAIATTIGIVAALLAETWRFFGMVSPVEFLFGTDWNPQKIIRPGLDNGYGSIPLFWGTIFIGAIIAMVVAIPLGFMSAVYLTQYAAPGLRRWMKPVLEVLAGVPTVVYGYFAALSVAPVLRGVGESLGIPNSSSESALAAGLVMGVMIIPFVSSMADDSMAAVPRALRDGSLAMGATKSETITKVLIPAALPGVVAGVLLAISRAIGETMIVVMAAGLTARLTANPFASVTTVTVQIVQLLTGDQEFDSPKTLAAFALGLTLFLVTLFLNLIALLVVKRYREAYE